MARAAPGAGPGGGACPRRRPPRMAWLNAVERPSRTPPKRPTTARGGVTCVTGDCYLAPPIPRKYGGVSKIWLVGVCAVLRKVK